MPKATFEDALKAFADRERQGLEKHPSADDLLAYHLRRLESADIERIQDHLAICPECASFILRLGPVSGSERGPDALSIQEEQVQSEWERLKRRLEQGESAKIAQRVPLYGQLRFAYSLAAALLVAVVGLSVWFPRDEMDAVANAGYVDLVIPDASGTRGVEEAALRASDRPQNVLFIVQLGEVDYPNFRAEIRSEDGSARQVDGLVKNSRNEVTFRLTRTFRPGPYQVRIYGSEAEGEAGTPLHEYSFLVQ